MARGLLADDLLVHNFHLLDVDWSMSVPPFVLWPAASFSSITMPEMTIETEEVPEGTSYFPHTVIKKGTVSPITLSKGSSMFNSDFWRWTTACLKGTPLQPNLLEFMAELAKAAVFAGNIPVPGKRRNLALIHLSNVSLEGLQKAMDQGDAVDKLKAIAAAPAAGIQYATSAIETLTGGLVDLGITSIPAKVWMLFDALPISYKPGSDFDAATSAVSIQEMQIKCHRFEEFALLA